MVLTIVKGRNNSGGMIEFMAFLLGTMVASTNMGGGLGPLGQIPLRCYAAFDISEKEYKDCRRLSMTHELLSHSQWRADMSPECFNLCMPIRLTPKNAETHYI